MPRFLIYCLFIVLALPNFSQSTDNYVRFYGQVLSSKDSTPVIGARMSYEKLPYYDDMAVNKSGQDGAFEFYLVDGDRYNFKLSKTGFQQYFGEVQVMPENRAKELVYNFFIEPEEVPDVISLKNLRFGTNSEVITPSSFSELDELAQYMDENPIIEIQLEGHTDFGGNAENAMALSLARVTAVKEYLTGKGIKKSRILTKAFGGTQPLTQDRTPEGRARNRRVEVRILRR